MGIFNYLNRSVWEKDITQACRFSGSTDDVATAVDELKWLCSIEVSAEPGAYQGEWKDLSTLKELDADLIRAAIDGCPDRPELLSPTVSPATSDAATPSGGIDSSALPWGLTEFLVRRADEELNAWFFEKFRQSACGEGSEYRAYLVNTCTILSGSQLSEFFGGTATLREAARADLKALPRVIPLESARELSSSTDPLDLSAREKLDSLLVLSVLGSSIEGVLDGSAPILAVIDSTMGDPSLLRLVNADRAPTADSLVKFTFLARGLLTEQKGELKLRFPTSPAASTSALRAMVANMVEYYSPAGNTLDVGEFRNDFGTYSGAVGPVAVFLSREQSIVAMKNAVDDLGTAIRELEEVIGDGAREQDVARALVLVASRSTAVLEEWYSLPGLPQPSSKVRSALQVSLPRINAAVCARNYPAALLELLALASRLELEDEIPEGLLRVTSFVVDVSQAQDANSVAGIIENYAAPVGSYKRKRTEDGFYVRVNAYVGAMLAHETAVLDPVSSMDNEGSLAFGPWVPLGLEIGRGNTWGGSLGGFVQLIDVGALATYRVDSGSVAHAPEVGFDQVFSPGLYGMYGFRTAPLSVGLGASYSPKLRELDPSLSPDGDPVYVDSWRIGIVVALDLPLFP